MRVHVVAHNYSVQCHVPEKKKCNLAVTHVLAN